jgi:MYXO-CTERM domain-containing protein
MHAKKAIAGAAAALALSIAVPAHAAPIDINGGSSWGGWTLHGRSDATGIYGTGPASNPYNVYTTVFAYNGETATGGVTGGGGGLTGFGGFETGDTVLGVGIAMLGGETVSGGRTLRIDLGNNSYVADSDGVGGVADGRTSSTTYANDGDFNVQNSTGFVANQLTVFTPGVNITAESANTINGGTRPFASFRQTSTYQIFIDLSDVEEWRALSVATLGISSDPIGTIGSSLTFALNGYGTNNVVIDNLSTSTVSAAVPEPGSLALAALGLLGLGAVRRRKTA